jgi:hypothetical protein
MPHRYPNEAAPAHRADDFTWRISSYGKHGTAINESDSPAVAARPVLLIAAALFVLEMALARRYGFHGDELYFLDSRMDGRSFRWPRA